MPLYEYRCLDCGDVSEVLQKLNDPPLRRCKRCSGKVEKLVSRTSFQLKGGGWYSHGYATGSAGTPPADKAQDKPGASGESKAGSASAKGEAKSDKSDKGDAKSDSARAAG
jgi:putative FmdB family regulatory protein